MSNLLRQIAELLYGLLRPDASTVANATLLGRLEAAAAAQELPVVAEGRLHAHERIDPMSMLAAVSESNGAKAANKKAWTTRALSPAVSNAIRKTAAG